MSTVDVRIYHNIADDHFFGYQTGHPIVLVCTLRQAAASDEVILEQMFHLFNVGDDPDFGTPDPRAVEYRRRRNRSLSVGDVVDIAGRLYACAGTGWTPVTAPTLSTDSVPGTTYLHIVPDTEEECRHVWVAGMIYVADEDLDTVAAIRPVKCEKCDSLYARRV